MRLSRVAEISSVFMEEGLGFLTESKPAQGPEGSDAAPSMSSAEIAARLRRTLEKLGPTFVKFGQMLATRIDLFGPEIVDELSKLQSHVPPFPTDEARRIVEEQLGKKIPDVFASFPDEPIAAASIAQVYKARLRGEGGAAGEWVAVKVQRPGLEQSLLSDLDVLVDVSGLIDRLVPAYRRSMVHRVAEEYAHRARGELDFVAEARVIDEFGALFTTYPEFRAPRVHPSLSTARVLVMEWLEGKKLDAIKSPEALRAAGYPPHDFARSMLRLQVSMAYEHGLVHGDTHPGNLILLGDGKIGVIDFGLHARVPPTLRDKMLEMVLHQAAGRIDESIDAYCSVLAPDAGVDLAAFKRDLREVFDGAGETGKQTMGEGPITRQFVRALRVASKHRIKAQSELFVVIRNLTIVEGIVARYAPDLDPVPEVRTITADIVKRRLTGPRMREEITQLMPQIFLTISKRPQLVERLLKLERAFVESATLGEFLERQDVIRRALPRSTSPLLFGLVLAIGLGLGVLLDRVLGGP